MNEREEIIDTMTSAISTMANEMAAFEEKAYWDAINFFNVNTEDIRDRCERCFYEGDPHRKTLRIDGKDAVTILDTWRPGEALHWTPDEAYKLYNVHTLKAIRHYLGESE